MKIAICIPHSYENFQKYFVRSLLSLTSSFYIYNSTVGNKHEINVFIQDEGWIDFMRERLAEQAIEKGYTHLLWLDTDMSFPPGMIQRMIEWFERKDNLEAVTGLYTWKKPPYRPHTYISLTEEGRFTVGAGFPTDAAFSVEGAGYGCLMIKADVYKRTEKPWFQFRYPSGQKDDRGEGEDLYFFRKAKGIEMLCDPTISCNHFVQNAYNLDSYIDYNNLTVDDGQIIVSDEQISAIQSEVINN